MEMRMTRYTLRSGATKLALAALFAAGMTAAPFTVSDDLGLDSAAAFAKGGNGGGNDKGGRGGNDKGGRGGNDHGGNGKGGNSANAGKSDSSLDAAGEETEVDDVETAKKNGWGSLSASHASARAREMAAEGSQVNNVADYEAAIAAEDLDAAAAALAAASNKEITPERVGMVNNNLGIEATPEEEAALAAQAEAIRSGEVEGEPEEDGEMAAGEGEEGDSEEAPDEIAQAADELVDGSAQ
jgi:hypothetical protein